MEPGPPRAETRSRRAERSSAPVLRRGNMGAVATTYKASRRSRRPPLLLVRPLLLYPGSAGVRAWPDAAPFVRLRQGGEGLRGGFGEGPRLRHGAMGDR